MYKEQTQSPGALSRKAAAEYLGISIRTLDSLASAGKLQRLKIGRKTIFRVSALEGYLDSLEVGQ